MIQIHRAVLDAFEIPARAYTLTQLRYDMRKLKAHGLVERHAGRYAYRLSEKGIKVALMFTLFHKHVCGPLANSLFHHRPDPTQLPDSKLHRAYAKADMHIQRIIDLLHAAQHIEKEILRCTGQTHLNSQQFFEKCGVEGREDPFLAL